MINLLFTGNDKIFEGLSLSLISITEHCKEPLNVYVLTMDLKEQNKNYLPLEKDKLTALENLIKQSNPDSKINLIDVTELFKREHSNSKNMENSYSPYAFIRLLADEVAEIPDKILYFDIDIMANGDIKELYDTDISEVEYGAVRDYYGKIFINRNYINSGVMLLNMKRIRETGLFKKAREYVNTKKMAFPDQTALNKCVEKRIFLARKFNSQRKMHKDDVVRHFCKSIRWYPKLFTKKENHREYCQIMHKFLPFFHTVNIKPWHEKAVRNTLKCKQFDKVYERNKDFKQSLVKD